MKEMERLKSDAIMSMSDLLVSYGFKPEDAIKESTNFWNKHKKKLRDAGWW